MARQHLSADAACHKEASHPTQSRAQEATRCGAVTTGLHSRPLGQGDQHSQATFLQREARPSSPEPEPPGEGHRRVLCTASSLVHRVARLPNITCCKGSVAPA